MDQLPNRTAFEPLPTAIAKYIKQDQLRLQQLFFQHAESFSVVDKHDIDLITVLKSIFTELDIETDQSSQKLSSVGLHFQFRVSDPKESNYVLSMKASVINRCVDDMLYARNAVETRVTETKPVNSPALRNCYNECLGLIKRAFEEMFGRQCLDTTRKRQRSPI